MLLQGVGSNRSRGGAKPPPPCPLTLTTEFLSQLYMTLWTELLAKNNCNFLTYSQLNLGSFEIHSVDSHCICHYCMQAGCVRRCWAVHQSPRYPSVTVWRSVMMMISTVSTSVDQWWDGTRRHSSVPQGTPRCLISQMRTLTASFNSSSLMTLVMSLRTDTSGSLRMLDLSVVMTRGTGSTDSRQVV